MVTKQAEKQESQTDNTPEEANPSEAATDLLKELDALEEQEAQKDTKADSEDSPESKENKDTGTDSPPDKEAKREGYKKRTRDRFDRLKGQHAQVKGERDQVVSQLKTSEEKNKLLELKLAQLEGKATTELIEPKPDNYDGGELDDQYIADKKKFDEAKIENLVKTSVKEATRQFGESQSIEVSKKQLEQKQKEHWSKADELEVQDYDEMEEKAVKTIGPEMVTNIIDYFPGESHKLIYYLGTNEEKAEEIGELLADRKTLVAGVAELGRLIEVINGNKPKQSETIPDPDEETEGSAPSPVETLQTRLNSLRESFAKNGSKGGLRKILDFKKKARERGFELR